VEYLADEKKHPEILAQLQVYGYLYEKNTGEKPVTLEAFFMCSEGCS
jgi:hypothetical protein